MLRLGTGQDFEVGLKLLEPFHACVTESFNHPVAVFDFLRGSSTLFKEISTLHAVVIVDSIFG